MNHLPYKEWLLSDANLSPEQAEALNAHINECETCRQLESSWEDAHTLIKKAQTIEPRPGFTDRFHQRLAEHRLRRQRRFAWQMVGVTGSLAMVLMIIFGFQLINMLSSPGNIILYWISRLTSILSVFWAFENMRNSLVAQFPSLSWLLLMFGMGIISFLSVLWLATIRKLTLVRRSA